MTEFGILYIVADHIGNHQSVLQNYPNLPNDAELWYYMATEFGIQQTMISNLTMQLCIHLAKKKKMHELKTNINRAISIYSILER